MKILIACEFSATVRTAFQKRGHDAWSCDLEPSLKGGKHIRGDVLAVLDGWDMIIAHPPCTYLSASGYHWTAVQPDRAAKTQAAIDFVKAIWAAPCKHLVIENPVGVMSSRWLTPTQTIQPYFFGEDASKATCLWIRGLPLLKPTKYVPPGPNGRWANQTETGQTAIDGKGRAKQRSITYRGIAEAMAEQWQHTQP